MREVVPLTGDVRREPTGGDTPRPDAQSGADVERRILQAVRSLDYGSVEVVVHDSQVVQIERREKLRFNKPAPSDPGCRRRTAGSRRPRQSESSAH